MQVITIILMILMIAGLCTLIGFQVYKLVQAIKNRKKIKAEETARKEKLD